MRLSAFITTCMAMVLAVSLLPSAAAQTPTDAERPSTRSHDLTSDEVGWSPGELDVDWAGFVDRNQTTYESGRWSSLDTSGATALREQAVAEYQSASGAAPEGPSYSSIEEQRTGAIAQQYYDECDDGSNLPDGGTQARRATLFGGGEDVPAEQIGNSYNPTNPDSPSSDPAPNIDLRSMFILQSADDTGRFDQTAFLVYACDTWGMSDLGAGGITFGLYTNFDGEQEYPTVLGDEEAGPDFVVTFFPENNVPGRPLQVAAIRTPTRDSSTWTLTYLDQAGRVDEYEIDGVVPTSAIGDFTADSGFAWTVEVVDTQQPLGGRDWFPERNYQLVEGEGDGAIQGVHVPQFPVPDDCGVQTEGNFVLEPQAVTPNDDGYPFQWYHPQISTPDAWDTIRDSSQGGRDRPVTVAVIDTGIDSTRYDFWEGGVRVVGGLDTVYGLELEGADNDGAIGPIIGPQAIPYKDIGAFPRNSDRGPHGTAVASLIGAGGNNEFGIAGVDWGVHLMPIRVVDVNGCITADHVADGIKWAVDHGADLINVSLASPESGSAGDGADRQPECNDGIDNDGDGSVDTADPGCVDEQDGSEGPAEGDDRRDEQAPACADGRDNDGDGRLDGNDSDCADPNDNREQPDSVLDRPAEPTECSDGIDNDADGFPDLADPGCDGEGDGSEGPLPADFGVIAEDAPACSDNRDNNDADPFADRFDPECDNPDDNNEGRESETRSVDPLRETVDYALEQGVPVITASGNYGTEGDPVTYPAAYAGVITVGATARDSEYAFYSSTGRWLDIVAPGGSNTRTLGSDLAVLWELDRIRSAAGTSFATPLVTGAASLYLGLNPQIARGFEPAESPPDPAANFPDDGYQRTVDDVKIGLQIGANDRESPGHDIFTGWGMLNVDRLLDVEPTGGPLVDPARAQLPRTEANSVVQAAENIALTRPQEFFPYVVFTRVDVAVDALAASPLLADGPLLVSRTDHVSDSTMATLSQVLPAGGQVYLIGGEEALSPAVQQQIQDAGYRTTRLSGASRFETSVAIAEEVLRRWPDAADQVGIVRADGGDSATAQWADALTGGAWAANENQAMLVTPTQLLHPVVAEALARWGTTSTVVFGGQAAIDDSVMSQLPGPQRIAGDTRADTATAVAEQLWSGTDGYILANGYYARGWVPGLASAGLAADLDRPLLYTGASRVPPATLDLLNSTCPGAEQISIVGGATFVSGTAESALLEAVTC